MYLIEIISLHLKWTILPATYFRRIRIYVICKFCRMPCLYLTTTLICSCMGGLPKNKVSPTFDCQSSFPLSETAILGAQIPHDQSYRQRIPS